MPGGFQLLGGFSNPGEVPTTKQQLTAPVSTNTKGASTNIGGTTSFDACALLLECTWGTVAATTSAFDLMIGSTVVVPNVLLPCPNTTTVGFGFGSFLIPLNVPSGSQLAGQYQSSNISNSVYLGVRLFDGSFTNSSGPALYEDIGTNVSGATGGTSLISGTAGVKGSFSVLAASAANDYVGFFMGFDLSALTLNTSQELYIDIALGGVGVEQVILPDYLIRIDTNSGISPASPICSPFFPISIASGTRITAKCSSSSATQNLGIAIYGARA